MHDVQLKTGGLAYGGWKSMRVQRSMEQCANSFELEVSELWPGQDYTRQIKPGESCELAIDGFRVISGYVDEVSIEIGAAQHTVRIAGRDKTADLVDCSAIHKTGQWAGRRIEQIAADLAAPFKIKVLTEVDTGKPLTSFALQEGETVFEAIDRAARIRALLLVSDADGNLVITRAGTSRIDTDLVLGDNVLEASASLSLTDRYSLYVAKGQSSGVYFETPGAPAPKQYAQVRAQATDPGVPRLRPLVLHADAPDVAASLQARVTWEANVRRARSTQVNVKVQGWTHARGLWQPNRLVNVDVAPLRIKDEMLLKSVAFELDDNGTTTSLALTMKDAFSELPIKAAGTASASATYLEGVKGPKK